ncbi:MAG TPA: hydroxyethylthiazole kinase [Sedimentibacter sp.]|jgi:hydroxyethylthiazole kinase|nr:hydroxyethylthiazole kinase [Sedimentibacter sp.]NLA13082.1 hydroxyethylthiazole kinase [Tissierellia bacterium]HOG62293.1 hydroxyethylthiazole kinase [Sedimentibacter sp.]HPB79156.1 hydroxyethylthiazole kinase [Sedimentibacter sp.]HPV84630.1 hydroxyethylthiazole kinase [Sedimentibacter sp.]
MFSEIIKNVKNNTPLVHNITNYVTVNDCANILLACGGSPIMADDIEEVEEIVSISSSLVINIGTLNSRTIESMIKAGKKANEQNIPVILDPVGVGASRLRTDTANKLLNEVKFAVVRGNISEIKALGNTNAKGAKGVDADLADSINEENLDEVVEYIKSLSEKLSSVIAVTGAIDIVSDSKKTYIIRNGHPMMGKISGTGCMLSSIIGAYCGANKDNIVDATAAAVCIIGLSGELAYEKILKNDEGTSMLRSHLIDFMSKIDDKILEEGAKFEIRQ